MSKNKGFIGLGLIIAIVLGIAVVGGGAYYLGKGSLKQGVNKLPVLEEKSTNTNTQVVNVLNSSINVISPNGGEVYKDSDKIAIKWAGTGKDNIAIYLRFSDGGWCFIKDVPSSTSSYSFTLYGNDCVNGKTISAGKYKVTLIAYEKGGMSPEPGTAFATSYNDNDGKGPGFSIDSSDNSFTINSSEESSTESFKSQPGAIKSIKVDGTNKWVLAVDLLSNNPNWVPGEGEFFINQNPKIRNLTIDNSTKIQNCTTQNSNYASGFNNDLPSLVVYIGKVLKERSSEYTSYFDIDGNKITAIYEQCLP